MKDGKRRRPKLPKQGKPEIRREIPEGRDLLLRKIIKKHSKKLGGINLEKLFRRKLRFLRRYIYKDLLGDSTWDAYQVEYSYKEASQYFIHGGPRLSLWHGTKLACIALILNEGQLKPSLYGLLGAGVYCGPRKKAEMFSQDQPGGILLELEVYPGGISENKWSEADTIYAGPGPNAYAWFGTLRNAEYCVRDPSRVRIIRVHVRCE
jgi:hypothetical protein